MTILSHYLPWIGGRQSHPAPQGETAFDLENIDPLRLAEFLGALIEHGYRSDVVWARTREMPIPFTPGTVQEAIYDYLFQDRPALLRLLKLFLSTRLFSRYELLKVLPLAALTFLLESGLLEQVDDGYRAPFLLFPMRGRYIVTDHLGGILSVRDHSKVFQLNKEQNILANALLSAPCEATLDLCTGSGVFAIMASAYSTRVCAVDVNPRAINFARFNALLNGIGNIEFFMGDLYQPIEGMTFDNILANPPYNPGCGLKTAAKLSIHGGFSGEEILFRIIEGLDRHLRPNGSAQIMSRFFYDGTPSYADRLKAIIDPDGFNMLLLQTRPREIFTLSNLLKTSWSVGPDGLAELGAYYRRRGIDKESFGILNMRRVSGGGKFRDDVMDFDFALNREFGPTIEERLTN